MTSLFFEMFSGLPRQGPGDTRSTLKALGLVPALRPTSRVLDIGCGTGAQTRVLAQHSSGSFVAIDNHAPFIEELNQYAQAESLADRIDGQVGDMRQLDFPSGSFELIWCEGAIYVVGFEQGLREWQRLLAPGGHMAVSEVCWMKPDPPADCVAFWAQEYPAIRDVPTRLKVIAECGYQMVGHFPLPTSSWWNDYYGPLQQHVADFRRRHADESDAQELADQVQREIDMWHAYSEFYSYEFFVMRPR